MAKRRYICIHGHFYQPPRENPWLGVIERQHSAAPFHDWNSRITAECYGPNAQARITTGDGYILDVRNNYERISFNYGPTLLSWMERHRPDVYEQILAADRVSRARRGGHGNALAQAYNHTILPLMERRDKRTQILWGLEDFRHRFGRDPEGMWLPETAVDMETLELLAESGIKFTLLAPHQARRFRDPEATKTPKEATQANLDPTRPYSCALASGRDITIFFYDGPISRAVAFEGLLHDGARFAHRIAGAFREDRTWPQLVHIATDGESYGHHHRFGEMGLAYALHTIETKGLAQLTNYGEYLEKHPPRVQVEIAEQSSWSCAHGIERWRSDCGCNTGGRHGWNQRWRGPLRAALAMLRGRLDAIYERETTSWFAHPWTTRDLYIEALLSHDPDAVDRWLDRQVTRPLDADSRTTLLRLLDMQLQAQRMFTSCAWFFDEVSGIETVQNLLYAARALQIAAVYDPGLETEFLALLEGAPSNVLRSAREVYERHVRPQVVDLARVAAHYAIVHTFDAANATARFHNFDIEQRGAITESFGQTTLTTSQLRVVSRGDRAAWECIAAVIHFGGHDFHCALRGPLDVGEYRRLADELLETFRSRSMTEVVRLLDRRFDSRYYTLADVFDEDRRDLLGRITRDAFARFQSIIDLIYDQNRKLMEYVREVGAPLPRGFTSAAEQAIAHRLERAIGEYLKTGRREELVDLAAEARRWGVSPATSGVRERLAGALNETSRRLLLQPTGGLAAEIIGILEIARAIDAGLDLSDVQHACFDVIYGVNGDEPLRPLDPPTAAAVRALAERLRIHSESPLRERSRLRASVPGGGGLATASPVAAAPTGAASMAQAGVVPPGVQLIPLGTKPPASKSEQRGAQEYGASGPEAPASPPPSHAVSYSHFPWPEE